MPASSSIRHVGPHHPLHEEPVEPGLRHRVADAREHRGGGLAHRAGIAEPERDPADIGFVDDVRRADFQRDREAERRGRGGGLVGVGGETRLRARNAVGGEHGLDFGRVEPGSAVREGGGDRGAGGAGIGSVRIGPGRRALHQQRLVALVADAVQQRGDRLLGRFVGRHPGRVEQRARRRRGMRAEPGGEQVAASPRRGGQRRHRAR